MRNLSDVQNVRFTVREERPPNFDQIVAKLPDGKKAGVIFTYGDTVYNPSAVRLTAELGAHEATHVLQQTLDMTPEKWWETYIHNIHFRAEQELEAHRVEYQMFVHLGYSRPFRRRAAKLMAKRLSGPLYGKVITFADALKQIKQEV